MGNSFSPAYVSPVLHITHVTRAANDEILQFAHIDLVEQLHWNIPREQLICLSRAGAIFTAGYGLRCAEVLVASREPGNDPVIYTALDRQGFKLLNMLPDLP